jgi:hypothetical protein
MHVRHEEEEWLVVGNRVSDELDGVIGQRLRQVRVVRRLLHNSVVRLPTVRPLSSSLPSTDHHHAIVNVLLPLFAHCAHEKHKGTHIMTHLQRW